MDFDFYKQIITAEQSKICSCLYVVATPLGNLADITLRALSVLSNCDIIIAEDTRRTQKLLSYYQIKNKKIISYQHYNELRKAPQLIRNAKDKKLILALVSDAGTPCLSDPGSVLVKESWDKDFSVVPVPGASSIGSLVSVSAIACRRFVYEGFLPTKNSEKTSLILSWEKLKRPVLFFESPNRVESTINIIKQHFPESYLCSGRELTKTHEDIKHGSPEEIILSLQENSALRGEFTFIVDIVVSDSVLSEQRNKLLDETDKRIKSMLSLGLSQKDIVKNLKDIGLSRSEIYKRTLNLKNSKD
jgi:16S rRNA (cytidine1402-2'-O)-methyltransferase